MKNQSKKKRPATRKQEEPLSLLPNVAPQLSGILGKNFFIDAGTKNQRYKRKLKHHQPFKTNKSEFLFSRRYSM
jgi:hypothetical protein